MSTLPPELQKLSRFRVVRKLGAGGMGEVFLAEDTLLGRKVALKLLPEGLFSDPEIRRRFSQEARTVSALNHPQIVTIYDVGSADQRDFIAMEYVDGQTLREQIAAGPLEARRAFDVVAQTAGGLAAAHDAGVVHRDIKPENLMVTRNGQVKIMDFGLAKLVERRTAPLLASGLATVGETPQPTSHGTATGVILGTVSYMSPEQAQGRPVDHRTDIFSLGLVLYEALTGSRPFSGKSAVETLHAIINEEPVSAAQRNPSVPPEATEILGKALAKDPAERYQHAGDFALDLRRARRVVESGISRPAVRVSVAPTSGPRPILWAGVALAVAALAAGAWYLGRSGARHGGSNLAGVTLTPLTSEPGYEGEPTFSPDGETIAYVSNRTGNFDIFLKQVSGGPDVNITNSPGDDVQPAFSPDGKQIAFVSTRESRTRLTYENFGVPPTGGDIWVVPALGGSPRRIAESGNFPSWSPDGASLLFTSGRAFNKKVLRVPSAGGEAREIPIRSPGGLRSFRFVLYPTLSPDGKWVLVQVEQFRVFVAPSAGGGDAKLLCRGRSPVWAPDGRSVIYSNADPGKNFSLWRVPFSPENGAAGGPAEPVTVGRGVDTQATISHDGRQIAFTAIEQTFNLETIPFDAETGRVTGEVKILTSGNNDIEWKSPSPDGRSMVYGNAARIWRLDPGQAAYPLTNDPAFIDNQPRWSPDGRSILFEREPAAERGNFSVWMTAADGANPRQLVAKARVPYWMPDSRGITYSSTSDFYLYQLDLATGRSRRVTEDQTLAPLHTVSPDGKWIVYQSSAEARVTIRARPIDGGKTLVVASAPGQMGSGHPMLSPSGNWFYYQVDHKNMYRVPGPSQGWRKAEPVKVTNFPESGLFIEDPRLSMDGKQLIYSRGRITGDLWLLKFARGPADRS